MKRKRQGLLSEGNRLTSLMFWLLIVISVYSFNPATAAGCSYIYILSDGTVTDLSIQRDGDTYTFTANINADGIRIQKGYIEIDGNGYTLEGPGVCTAIEFDTVNGVTIHNLTITNNWDIRFLSSAWNTITQCTITQMTVQGIYLDSSSSNNEISENYISSSPIRLQYYSSENTITGNTIIGQGIYLFESSYNNISYNWISSATEGIRLEYYSDHNTIYKNKITDHDTHGIELERSSHNVISKNQIMNNESNGINLYYNCRDNTITENYIASNDCDGLAFQNWCDSNTISENRIMWNGWSGLYSHLCDSNIISANNIISNDVGIVLAGSYHSSVYHNNFIDNTYQAAADDGYPNVWDDGYPSGGNYWSNFDEPGEGAHDTDGDGIVDDPYVIAAQNQDNYPLIQPWRPPDPVVSSRLVATLDTVGNLGNRIIWSHPDSGQIWAGNGGSLILGTDFSNLAIACGQTGQKYSPVDPWTTDTLYFSRTVSSGSSKNTATDAVTYMFERHYTYFEHPILDLGIELFAVGTFDPEHGPCEDAVSVKYVIHNFGDASIDNIEKAVYLDLDVEPDFTNNAVDGVDQYSTIWVYENSRLNILFGVTQMPVYQGGGACGGRGVSSPAEIWPESGWDPSHLKEVMDENAWNMNPYDDQPTDVGIMLIDHEFSLAPSEKYCNEYIIWAYDKDNPVDGLTLGQFLQKLMKQAGYYRGDVDCNGQCTIADVVYIVNYALRSKDGPMPFDDQGDVNCDGEANITDVVYLVTYLFRGGPPPVDKNRFFDEPYRTMFSRPGLVNDPVWRNLPFLVDP